MMCKIRIPGVLILLLALFTACTDESAPDAVMPVIEGWIDSDGYPTVLFTTTLHPNASEGSIADNMIRWGVVSISDGTEEVILTGSPDKNMLPPYRYYTTKMRGLPGRTYTVTASYKNLHATASCTMPQPVPIDKITIEKIAGNDTLRSARLFLTSPDDVPAYFCVTVREVKDLNDNIKYLHRPLPSMMGTIKATVAGEKIEIGLYNAKNYENSSHFVPQMIVGRRLVVSLNRVSKEVYDFWTEYDNYVTFGHSVFLTPASPPQGNIIGGLGVWSAQGSSIQNIEIK